jgi:hypothetical protein
MHSPAGVSTPIIAGKVRGEDIHFACATPEEALLTWGAFYDHRRVPDKDCARCGQPLKEVPQP